MNLVKRKESQLSPWVTLITRTVQTPPAVEPQIYHSLGQADYVTVVAITSDGRFPIVRQFRPAMERDTLEFPGGLLEKGEDPAASAKRELFEETGYVAQKNFTLLGCLRPDTGRLENKLWCFFAKGVKSAGAGWTPEANIEPLMMTSRELRRSIQKGQFDHALNIAALSLAIIQGKFSFNGRGKS